MFILVFRSGCANFEQGLHIKFRSGCAHSDHGLSTRFGVVRTATWHLWYMSSARIGKVCVCVCACVTLCSKEASTFIHFTFTTHGRGPMDTWMAWANEDPSKLSCKRTCKVAISNRPVLHPTQGCFRYFAGKQYWLLTSSFRQRHGYLYPSDKCVPAGRSPKATSWHGSRCDPRESRHCKTSACKLRHTCISSPLSLGISWPCFSFLLPEPEWLHSSKMGCTWWICSNNSHRSWVTRCYVEVAQPVPAFSYSHMLTLGFSSFCSAL